jgi:Uma2 family endonuclease
VPRPSANDPRPIRHRRAPSPLHFPVEATVPESKRHLKLRTLLFQILERELADRANIGCHQFVYWNAADPKVCLAPDAFVRLGSPDTAFDSWKTWERGAPELCVEIASEFDRSERSWEQKLARYRELGVAELVRFDPDAPAAEQLRVWDRIEGDLVEREVDQAGSTPCATLGFHWIVVPAEGFPAALRLARDPRGDDQLLTLAEAETRAKEREASLREAEAKAREAAERRVAELEAELRRRP